MSPISRHNQERKLIFAKPRTPPLKTMMYFVFIRPRLVGVLRGGVGM